MNQSSYCHCQRHSHQRIRGKGRQDVRTDLEVLQTLSWCQCTSPEVLSPSTSAGCNNRGIRPRRFLGVLGCCGPTLHHLAPSPYTHGPTSMNRWNVQIHPLT